MLPVKIRFTACSAALLATGLLAAVPLAAQAPDTMTITIPRTERPPQIEDFLVGGQLMPPVDGASSAGTGRRRPAKSAHRRLSKLR
jgi:hypothetical protein